MNDTTKDLDHLNARMARKYTDWQKFQKWVEGGCVPPSIFSKLDTTEA